MNPIHRARRRGFTLIELLVVIGIIVILSVVVVLTINPAQLLAQARDSTRVSDMATLKSALALFLSDVATSSLAVATNCYVHATAGIDATAGCGRFPSGGVVVTSTGQCVNGATGASGCWIPVNFNAISAGAPLSALPVDPSNDTTNYYGFHSTTSLTYEITAELESTKYTSGDGDLESTDGGNSATLYEVGTNLNN